MKAIERPDLARRVWRGRAAPGVVALAAAVAMLTVACSGGAAGSTASSTTPHTEPTGARPSSTAQLRIVAPTNGQVFTGASATVPVKVSLTGATIVPVTSTHIVPNQGHLHVYVDNQIVSMNYSTDNVIHDVKPGLHILRVEFVASDHLPFDPRVIQQVTFEVKA